MGKNFKLNRLYHNIFGEKFYKKLKFRDYFYNYKEYLNIVYKEDLKNIF